MPQVDARRVTPSGESPSRRRRAATTVTFASPRRTSAQTRSTSRVVGSLGGVDAAIGPDKRRQRIRRHRALAALTSAPRSRRGQPEPTASAGRLSRPGERRQEPRVIAVDRRARPRLWLRPARAHPHCGVSHSHPPADGRAPTAEFLDGAEARLAESPGFVAASLHARRARCQPGRRPATWWSFGRYSPASATNASTGRLISVGVDPAQSPHGLGERGARAELVGVEDAPAPVALRALRGDSLPPRTR